MVTKLIFERLIKWSITRSPFYATRQVKQLAISFRDCVDGAISSQRASEPVVEILRLISHNSPEAVARFVVVSTTSAAVVYVKTSSWDISLADPRQLASWLSETISLSDTTRFFSPYFYHILYRFCTYCIILYLQCIGNTVGYFYCIVLLCGHFYRSSARYA